MPTQIKSTKTLGPDLIVLSWPNVKHPTQELTDLIKEAASIDNAFDSDVRIIKAPGGRIIYSPTGPIDADYDDVQVLAKAASNGIKRVLKAGVKNPTLVLRKHESFPDSELVILLGALEALYVVITTLILVSYMILTYFTFIAFTLERG